MGILAQTVPSARARPDLKAGFRAVADLPGSWECHNHKYRPNKPSMDEPLVKAEYALADPVEVGNDCREQEEHDAAQPDDGV